MLIPNSKFCTTIITSQKSYLKIPIQYINIQLEPFTDKEALILFKEVLKDKYVSISTNAILKLAKKVENLPLALHILARGLLHTKIPISKFHTLLNQEKSIFQDLYYEDRNLYATIATSYKKLDSTTKSVLVSASIFKGKDFSLRSIGYINGLSMPAITKILQNLINLSLIEYSTKNRYRIHPSIREFVRDKLDYPRSSNLIFIAVLIFLFFAIWWLFLQLFVNKNDIMYFIFSAFYGLMAFYGGIYGIHTSLSWGGLKTLVGKAIFMFSIGLFTQEFGQFVYSYYAIFEHIKAPYPSVGDIGYFGTIPLYTYGTILLAKSSGIKLNIKSFKKTIIAFIIPIIILTTGYLLFLQNYNFNWNAPLKIFLDFGYPLGEAIYISAAIVTFIFSRTILDGILRSKALLILVALVFQFLADYIFLYDSSGFYPGNYVDFVYLIAYFMMTLALLNLRSIHIKIH